MRVLVVGGGGREHALVWRLAQNPTIDRLFAAPGNAGMAPDATRVPVPVEDLDGLVALVERERIDLTVVGPEVPLVAGLADVLLEHGHLVFGPTRGAARIEGSKAWAKELCLRHGVPTGGAAVAEGMDVATDALDTFGPPYVVKADGLAGGKGVVIVEDRTEAIAALEACLVHRAFGPAGARVLVEEHLTGREVSAFAVTDGRHVLPLAMVQDFKRVDEGDLGPNTGGMGAYSPVPFVDPDTRDRIWDEILRRAIRAMAAEGTPYRGVLYAGLMLTDDGPKVLEFNCRFGDPETQALIPLLRSDLAELCLASAEGNLGPYRALLAEEACVTVVVASGGYPGAYTTDIPIEGLGSADEVAGATVFHAGTEERQGRVVTSGGRVLSVTGRGGDLAEARERAYDACARIRFEGMHYRRDIAARAAEEERG